MTHIQKMAPGPPMSSAPQAPTMLPVPTWAAMAVVRAWKELMPPPCLPPRRLKLPKSLRHPSPKQRTWTNLVRMVKNRPVPTSKKSKT